jgi:hypothetical protein
MGPSWMLGEVGDPARQAGGRTGSWHQTVEEVDVLKMLEGTGDRLGTTSSHVYAQSTYHMCNMCDNSLHLNNYDCEPCLTIPICFRRVNHMAVKNHLHSSSGVREVVSGKLTPFYVL